MLNDNWLIKNLDTIDSTQTYAQAFHYRDKQVVINARHQTNGYGQYGREWIGIEDNLSVSLVVPAKKLSPEITLVTSMAIGDVILRYGVNIQYKWVNDILIDSKKIGGILTEYFKGNLIIGIGINIKNHPKMISNFPATNLLENGINISSDKFLDLMLKSFTETYNKWLNVGFKDLRMLWKTRAYKLNSDVIIIDEDRKISGTFVDIDEGGRIVIQNESGLHILQSGSMK